MTTAFPGAIDAFTNPTATDALDSATVPHATQHANINDAVEAIETAIGTTGAPVLAKLASPTFTGTPAAPTAAVGTNTTQLATTAFVQASNPGFGYMSGFYYRTRSREDNVTAVVSNTYYYQLSIPYLGTFDRIALKTGTTYSGTGLVRMGIYNNSGANKPSTVLLDAGTVSTTAANTVYEITISQTLSAGSYWLAFNMQTAATTPTYAGNAAATGFSLDGLLQSSTAMVASTNGGWIETGITGAFATAGTITNNNTFPQTTVRAS